jgi:hypothetical protein
VGITDKIREFLHRGQPTVPESSIESGSESDIPLEGTDSTLEQGTVTPENYQSNPVDTNQSKQSSSIHNSSPIMTLSSKIGRSVVMGVKDKIKDAFSKKVPETKLEGKPEGKRKAKFSYEEVEDKPRSSKSSWDEPELTPEGKKRYEQAYQSYKDMLTFRARTGTRRVEDKSQPGKYKTEKVYDKPIEDWQREQIEIQAREMAKAGPAQAQEYARAQREAIEMGIPQVVTELKRESAGKGKGVRYVEHPRELSDFEKRQMAAEARHRLTGLGLETQRWSQGTEAERELYPWEKEVAKHTLAGQLEEAQMGLSQVGFEREKLQPKAQSLQLWEADKAIKAMQKEKFAETKRGKALNLAGKVIDKGASGFAGGMGNAALGMGMALRSGPSVDTAIYTGRFTPRNVNMQTPASQAHSQTWIQAGRAMAPSSKSPAGRALGTTNVPAGMAMLPNLKNLNPAIKVNPRGFNLGTSRLSPLPRRRQQPPQQTEPGASRVR